MWKWKGCSKRGIAPDSEQGGIDNINWAVCSIIAIFFSKKESSFVLCENDCLKQLNFLLSAATFYVPSFNQQTKISKKFTVKPRTPWPVIIFVWICWWLAINISEIILGVEDFPVMGVISTVFWVKVNYFNVMFRKQDDGQLSMTINFEYEKQDATNVLHRWVEITFVFS